MMMACCVRHNVFRIKNLLADIQFQAKKTQSHMLCWKVLGDTMPFFLTWMQFTLDEILFRRPNCRDDILLIIYVNSEDGSVSWQQDMT